MRCLHKWHSSKYTWVVGRPGRRLVDGVHSVLTFTTIFLTHTRVHVKGVRSTEACETCSGQRDGTRTADGAQCAPLAAVCVVSRSATFFPSYRLRLFRCVSRTEQIWQKHNDASGDACSANRASSWARRGCGLVSGTWRRLSLAQREVTLCPSCPTQTRTFAFHAGITATCLLPRRAWVGCGGRARVG